MFSQEIEVKLLRETRKGDILGELFYWSDKKLQVGGAEIIAVETLDFEGTVYDIKGDSQLIFGRYLLGHMSDESW